jgi:hypothetical protein
MALCISIQPNSTAREFHEMAFILYIYTVLKLTSTVLKNGMIKICLALGYIFGSTI